MSLIVSTAPWRITRTQWSGSSSCKCMPIYRRTAGADRCGWGVCAPCPGACQPPLGQLSFLSWLHEVVVEVLQAGESWTTQPRVSQLKSCGPLLLSGFSCWQTHNRRGNTLFHSSVHFSIASTKARSSSCETQSFYLFSFTGKAAMMKEVIARAV